MSVNLSLSGIIIMMHRYREILLVKTLLNVEEVVEITVICWLAAVECGHVVPVSLLCSDALSSAGVSLHCPYFRFASLCSHTTTN